MNKSALLFPLIFLGGAVPEYSAATQMTSATTEQCINVPWPGARVERTLLPVKPCERWRNRPWNIKQGQTTGAGGLCLDVEGGNPHRRSASHLLHVHAESDPELAHCERAVRRRGGKYLDIRGGRTVRRGVLDLLHVLQCREPAVDGS